MKYIDTDLLRKEIDHRIDILADMSIKCAKNDDTEMHAYYHGEAVSLQKLLSFIDSLQQEQPSLPDLDEAARDIVIKMHPCLKDCTILGDRLTRGQLMALVKAGAEWAMQQLKGE